MSVQSQGKVFAAAPAPQLTERDMQRRYVLAWALCLVFYFLQYALRSAPGLMTHELSAAFGLSALGLSSIMFVYLAGIIYFPELVEPYAPSANRFGHLLGD